MYDMYVHVTRIIHTYIHSRIINMIAGRNFRLCNDVTGVATVKEAFKCFIIVFLIIHPPTISK